jgi:hypothetical protein
MSYILDALKRAERKAWRGKAPKSRTVEPAVELPAWEVKMVSPARFERFRAVEAGDATEQKGNGLPKGVGVAAAILTLLLLIECAVIYEVRGRMSTIATEVSKLTRQVSKTEAQLTKGERERLNLKMENESLRQELEVAGADLARARDAVQKLKVKRRRLTAGKGQARVTDQEKSGSYRPLGTERAPGLDAVETATAASYSIR